MKKFLILFFILLTLPSTSKAEENLYSQQITLKSGWNLVSTPRLIESHAFSLPETSSNFDIYILSPKSPSGWLTMSDLSQTEFKPLFGYFINNKTSTDQSLTFNYRQDVDSNGRFFSRIFDTVGWYSIGISNPTYAKKLLSPSVYGTDNNSNILNSIGGNFTSVIDLNDKEKSSVSVGDTWKESTLPDINSLNIFKEIKGYAVYISKTGSSYTGFQNNDPITNSIKNIKMNLTASTSNPVDATISVHEDSTTDDILSLSFNISNESESTSDVVIDEIPIILTFNNNATAEDFSENVINSVVVRVDGVDYEASLDRQSTSNGEGFAVYKINPSDGVCVLAGETKEFKVYLTFNSANSFSKGITIGGSVNLKDFMVLDDNFEFVNLSEYEDSQNGGLLTLMVAPPVITGVTASSRTDTDSKVGTFTFKFTVEADGYDVALNEDAFVITGTGSSVSTFNILKTSGTVKSDYVAGTSYTIEDGNKASFTVTYTVSGVEAGQYFITLESIAGVIVDETSGPESLIDSQPL